MLVFNCSQTARKFFSRKVERKSVSYVEPAPCPDWRDDIFEDENGNPACLEQWQVHMATYGYRRVLFAMHMPTRFVLTLVDVAPGEVEMFVEHLIGSWLSHMLSLGHSLGLLDETDYPDVMQHFMQAHSEFSLFARTDLSVGAHIAQVCDHFQYLLDEAGVFPRNEEEVEGFDDQANIQTRKIGKKGEPFEPYYAMFRHWWPYSGLAERVPLEVMEQRLEEHRRAVMSRLVG